MNTFEYPEEVVYARVESARKRDVRFAELEAQNAKLLEALRQCAAELGSIHGAGDDIKHARAHSAGLRLALEALAKASA